MDVCLTVLTADLRMGKVCLHAQPLYWCFLTSTRLDSLGSLDIKVNIIDIAFGKG